MPLALSCTNCQTPLTVGDEWAGHVITCPQCQQQLLLPPATPPAQEVPVNVGAVVPPHLVAPNGSLDPPNALGIQTESNTSASTHGQRYRRRKQSMGAGMWSGVGSVLMIMLIITLRLYVRGQAEASYDKACDAARRAAVLRLSDHVPEELAKDFVYSNHSFCVSEATRGFKTQRLDKDAYQSAMDNLARDLKNPYPGMTYSGR